MKTDDYWGEEADHAYDLLTDREMERRDETREAQMKLQVWWIPQVPMVPFEVEVKDVAEGATLLQVLADYDLFQFEHHVKPDYSNVGGLQMWDEDSDGEGNPGWVDWCSDEGEEPDEYTERIKGQSSLA